MDGRIIDVNLNKVYLKLILGGTVKKTIANLKLVDAELARSLERLQSYLQTRKEIEALQLPPGARRNKLMQLTVSGAKLADLSLDFTLPGYNIELKPGGAHIDVDDHNLEEYLEKVLDLTLGSGIAPQVKAFREGFSMLFSVEDMDIFSPSELGLLFGNAEEDWSRESESSCPYPESYADEKRWSMRSKRTMGTTWTVERCKILSRSCQNIPRKNDGSSSNCMLQCFASHRLTER